MKREYSQTVKDAIGVALSVDSNSRRDPLGLSTIEKALVALARFILDEENEARGYVYTQECMTCLVVSPIEYDYCPHCGEKFDKRTTAEMFEMLWQEISKEFPGIIDGESDVSGAQITAFMTGIAERFHIKRYLGIKER